VGEVERLVDLARGDVDDMGAQGQLFVGEAGVFAPEDQGGFVVGGGVEEGRGDFAGQAGVVAVHAGAGTGAGYDGAVANRFFQGLECFAGIEQVVGMAGEALGFVPVVSLVRINDSKVGDAHVHHGPADGANVAGALGFDEYDSDIFERIHDDWNVGWVEDWNVGWVEEWNDVEGRVEELVAKSSVKPLLRVFILFQYSMIPVFQYSILI
jgi:hypothetical protein